MIDKSILPAHWEVKKLGEVCEFEYGKALKKEIRDAAGKYDVYGSNGIVGKHSQLIIEDACIIVGRKGAAGEVHLSLAPAWPIDTTYFVKQKPTYDLKFLYYQLRSLQLNSLDKSTAIPGLNRNDAYQKQFILPPLSEQQEIVAKIEELFSELDKGKEQLETARQQLKVYRQAVLKFAFEGRFTNSEVKDGELPEEWKWVKIEDVANTYGGFAFKSGEFNSDGKYQVLRMGNVRPGILRYDENPVFLDLVEESILKKALLKINDVIITQTGTRQKRDYGFTALINKENLLLNQRIAAIRFKENFNPKFFLYYSWTDGFKDQFFANETGNVGQGNVGMKAVTQTLIPQPLVHEQDQIVQEIESRLSVCDKLEETITKGLQQAETLRQSILKQAFEGKLIPQEK